MTALMWRGVPQGWASGNDGGFRRRAESALTHPATIAALSVLLLNDLLFKAIWPESWVTGKLSDLAWLVFALPLLAFLLSFLIRNSSPAKRISFLAAYVGLPLLYVAFNTLDPVHDSIMRGISLMGGAATSPRDATDSLVIPPGWCIAILVWGRVATDASVLRRRWALLVAGVASLAAIASDRPSPVPGVVDVGTADSGEIVALTNDQDTYYPVDETGNYIVNEIDDGLDQYRSVDGGMTWRHMEERLDPFPWSEGSVHTPRGRFTLDGPRVMRADADGGQVEVAYSTAYLQEHGNMWIQNIAGWELGRRPSLAEQPQGLAFDEESGNLVLGLGIQGVVVGKPDGEWVGVPVDRYTPTDFSFWTKTRQLTLSLGFWITALTLAVSMTATGSVFGSKPWIMSHGGSFLVVAALISLIASVALLGTFGVPDGAPQAVLVFLAITSWLLSAICLAGTWEEPNHHRVVVYAVVGMAALVYLALMLWLHLGLSHETSKTGAVVLCGLAAIVLAGYVRRTGREVD